MDDFIADALEKGLIRFDLKEISIEEAKRRWLLLTELQYTRPQDKGDLFTSFLRINRRN